MNHLSVTVLNHLISRYGGSTGSVRFVGALDTFLQDLPELGGIEAPRYPHALLPGREQRCDGPAQLRPTVEGVVVSTLGDDLDGKPLTLVRVVG